MISNQPIDLFTIVLEDASTNGLKYERVIATNISTRMTAEARLNPVQIGALFECAYGGERSIIDNLLEQIEIGHLIELLANTKDPLIFSSAQLVQFGFDPDELEATQRIAS